ncbi:hypothetical protein HPP92_001668 [Vanilla planifolia]|uniref:Uncharacterized protein n=1 Tax=Vanilla planifolia TaxID=51239 RepID=A0A835S3T1_VANPL|nr:hypothetical protein HPP92_001668 [Vanilla planifolia]
MPGLGVAGWCGLTSRAGLGRLVLLAGLAEPGSGWPGSAWRRAAAAATSGGKEPGEEKLQ